MGGGEGADAAIGGGATGGGAGEVVLVVMDGTLVPCAVRETGECTLSALFITSRLAR